MRFVFVLGTLLLLLAVLFHPWLLARLFSPDASINEVNRFLVQSFRIVSFLAGLFLLGAGLLLRRSRPTGFERFNNVLINLCLVLASTLFMLGLTETMLRWLNPYGVNFFRESKKYFSQVIAPNPDPEIVYEHVPSYRGFMGDVEVRTNAGKLRDRAFTREKPEGVFRILCLGDSVTFGWGVPEEETYAKRLEARWNRGRDAPSVEVINTGVGGYNTTQEAAFLRTEGIRYHPDLILLFFAMNDAVEALQPFRPLHAAERPDTTDTVEPGMRWLAKTAPVMVASRFFPSLFGFYYYVTMPRVDYVAEFLGDDRPGWKACQEAILDIVRTARSIQADTVVFMLPAMQGLDEAYPFIPIHEAVQTFCRRHEIPFFDLLPDFVGRPDTAVRVSVFDGHPNAFAHGIVAESVYRKIRGRVPAPRSEEPPP